MEPEDYDKEENENDFDKMFGGIDEELEEKLFDQAILAMVRMYRTFRRNGLTIWEASCIVAAWLKNSADPPIREDQSNDKD